MPAGSSQHRATAPHARTHPMRAAHPERDARSARTTDASNNDLFLLKRGLRFLLYTGYITVWQTELKQIPQLPSR